MQSRLIVIIGRGSETLDIRRGSERPRTNVRGESGIASRPNALSALEPMPAEAFTPGIMMLMPRSQDMARL